VGPILDQASPLGNLKKQLPRLPSDDRGGRGVENRNGCAISIGGPKRKIRRRGRQKGTKLFPNLGGGGGGGWAFEKVALLIWEERKTWFFTKGELTKQRL